MSTEEEYDDTDAKKKEDKEDKEINVCTNQNVFNRSLSNALDYSNNKKRQNVMKMIKKNKDVYGFVLVLYLILLFMAISLAMRVKDDEHRVLHMLVAIVCPPSYIVAYFLGMLGSSQ